MPLQQPSTATAAGSDATSGAPGGAKGEVPGLPDQSQPPLPGSDAKGPGVQLNGGESVHHDVVDVGGGMGVQGPADGEEAGMAGDASLVPKGEGGLEEGMGGALHGVGASAADQGFEVVQGSEVEAQEEQGAWPVLPGALHCVALHLVRGTMR